MDELSENVAAERRHVEITLESLKETLSHGKLSVAELAGVATFLLNIYNGIENILKQVLRARGVRIPRSDAWHKQLLNEAVTRLVITPDLRGDLQPYLGFRHLFVHGYGYMLKEVPLLRLATDIPEVWSRFIAEVEGHLGA